MHVAQGNCPVRAHGLVLVVALLTCVLSLQTGAHPCTVFNKSAKTVYAARDYGPLWRIPASARCAWPNQGGRISVKLGEGLNVPWSVDMANVPAGLEIYIYDSGDGIAAGTAPAPAPPQLPVARPTQPLDRTLRMPGQCVFITSDLHMAASGSADPERQAAKDPPRESARMRDEVRNGHLPCDGVFVLGDLTDGTAAGHRAFVQLYGGIGTHLFVGPGNHDYNAITGDPAPYDKLMRWICDFDKLTYTRRETPAGHSLYGCWWYNGRDNSPWPLADFYPGYDGPAIPMGGCYKVKDIGKARFIMCGIACWDGMFAWLKENIQSAPGPVYLMQHIPPYSYCPQGGRKWSAWWPESAQKQFYEVVNGYSQVKAVFCGHWHSSESYVIAGRNVPVFVVGGDKFYVLKLDADGYAADSYYCQVTER